MIISSRGITFTDSRRSLIHYIQKQTHPMWDTRQQQKPTKTIYITLIPLVVISYKESDNSLGGGRGSHSLIPVDRSLIHHTQKQTNRKHTHKHNNSRDSKGWILISLRLWLPHLMKFNFCAVLGQSS